MLLDTTSGKMFISNSQFVNNSAGRSGGALSVQNLGSDRLSVNFAVFTNNTAMLGPDETDLLKQQTIDRAGGGAKTR